MNTNRSKLYRG